MLLLYHDTSDLIRKSTFSVELNSSFTYLIFQHALRIRLKSSTEGDEKDKGEDDAPTNSATTPTAAEADPSAASGVAAEVEADNLAEADDPTANDPAASKEGQTNEQKAHITGKISNLLTEDVSTMGISFNIVTIRMIPLTFVDAFPF